MKVRPTAIPGVVLIEPRVFDDERGFFMETWNAARYREAGIPADFVQGNHARSAPGVLRGLHFQIGQPQAKLLWVVAGEIFDVAVDIRRGSPTFGRWVGATLSAENRHQLFVPEGFAHGYCVTGACADVCYLCSRPYFPPGDRGVRWDDPAVGIAWPAGEKLLSPKDRLWPPLAEATELPAYPPPLDDEGPGGARHRQAHP